MLRTYEAIIEVLSREARYMDTEEIFIRLNIDKKSYSYAAVYNNVRKLCDLGVLHVQTKECDRRRYFALNEGWDELIKIK